MTVSKALRYQVLRRDGFTCQYCGGKPPDVALTVDHVIPSALGGSDEPSNLTTACRDCNAGKSATPPDAEQVASVDQRNTSFMDAMAQLASDASAARAEQEWFADHWNEWGWGPGYDRKVPMPQDAMRSVAVWLERGLTRDDILAAVPRAMSSRVPADEKFRYFAGICWSLLRERQDQAARILDGG